MDVCWVREVSVWFGVGTRSFVYTNWEIWYFWGVQQMMMNAWASYRSAPSAANGRAAALTSEPSDGAPAGSAAPAAAGGSQDSVDNGASLVAPDPAVEAVLPYIDQTGGRTEGKKKKKGVRSVHILRIKIFRRYGWRRCVALYIDQTEGGGMKKWKK